MKEQRSAFNKRKSMEISEERLLGAIVKQKNK